MATRKPTVLNPAGYQENLQDTDSLVLGVDKITLNAADGTSVSTGIQQAPAYYGVGNADADVVFAGYHGSNLNDPPTYFVKADGSARFNRSLLTSLNLTTPYDTDYTEVFDGRIKLRKDDASTAAISIYKDGATESDLTLSLSSDGTAYFGGNVEVSTGIDLNADGSASFASGNVKATTNDLRIENVSGGTPNTNYSSLSRLGGIDLYRSGANPQNDSIFRLRTNPSGTELTPIQFMGDGSVSVAGQIDIDGTGGFAGYGWAIANNGGMVNKTPSGATITLDNSGAATFAGALDAASIDCGTY